MGLAFTIAGLIIITASICSFIFFSSGKTQSDPVEEDKSLSPPCNCLNLWTGAIEDILHYGAIVLNRSFKVMSYGRHAKDIFPSLESNRHIIDAIPEDCLGEMTEGLSQVRRTKEEQWTLGKNSKISVEAHLIKGVGILLILKN